ncbi:Coenzyme F420 hydrogenase/dehydrogenase, beta subunit C-terminal domain [Thermohalobacter berrensis]|uniref:Coenzyme F420 hydrogenase n=1 Tax=Thermohalobacter berrensis TaxID=99594 RepID=A0A419T3Z3_9FIRM|nr:Coenzyme F420 hydrogenase/dehydrogenase, beta subunit C-terminal domain [Thermohalobacter berrensis]RKD32277.1 hypothetical protein BET03_02900 [Thermohalobacter berrensis]
MSIDFSNPQKYVGNFENCYAAYSSDPVIRKDAASGGIVTTLLIHLLKEGYVDGVFVSRQFVKNGKIAVESFVATKENEILDSRTSIYTYFSLEKSFDKIIKFDGKVAAVLLPCHIKMIEAISRKKPQLKEKIKYKIALFCGGVADDKLMYKILDKNKININNVRRIYSRKGHWRGKTILSMKDGTEKIISYTKNWSTYKNAFFYSTAKCFSCLDHFGYDADFSCGDIWLREMKKKKIKHTAVITKNKEAEKIFAEMIKKGLIKSTSVNVNFILKGNKRAIIYKYHTAEARKRLGKLFGFMHGGKSLSRSKWNHYIASFFILLNMKLSKDEKKMNYIFKIPKKLMYFYMVFIRIFISF